jgi:uncharacterized protein YdbL (DUF1318 family)
MTNQNNFPDMTQNQQVYPPRRAPTADKESRPAPRYSSYFAHALSALAILFLSSCAPKVQLATPEPLKVDIEMTVNVYQREVASANRKISEEELQALRRSEERAGEIWAMKNDGVIVESPTGYLETHPRSGWDTVYVNRIVAEENRDRKIKYEAEARDTNKPIETIQALAGKRLREQAYVTRTNAVQSVTVPAVPKTK